MPLNLGDTAIAAGSVYLGDAPVAVYHGDELILARSAALVGTAAGRAVYDGLVALGGSVLHGMFDPGRSAFPDRWVYEPDNETNPTGEFLQGITPTGFPNMPESMRRRESGGHNGRITMGITSEVNPGEWLYGNGTEDRFIYLVTINTHGSGDDVEHEWICVRGSNAASASAAGGGTWANIYPGFDLSTNAANRGDNINVREDLVGGRLAGTDRTASLATGIAYNTWVGQEIRLEAGNDPVEFVMSFAPASTFDPNA